MFSEAKFEKEFFLCDLPSCLETKEINWIDINRHEMMIWNMPNSLHLWFGRESAISPHSSSDELLGLIICSLTLALVRLLTSRKGEFGRRTISVSCMLYVKGALRNQYTLSSTMRRLANWGSLLGSYLEKCPQTRIIVLIPRDAALWHCGMEWQKQGRRVCQHASFAALTTYLKCNIWPWSNNQVFSELLRGLVPRFSFVCVDPQRWKGRPLLWFIGWVKASKISSL